MTDPGTSWLMLVFGGGAMLGALGAVLAARPRLRAARGACAELAQALAECERQRHEEGGANEGRLRESNMRLAAQQAELARLIRDLGACRAAQRGDSERLLQLSSEYAALRAGAAHEARAASEKLALLQRAEERLQASFDAVARQVLESSGQLLREEGARQLGGLLDPLKEQLREFRSAVLQTHANEQRERGMLAQEIRGLRESSRRMSEDAINLTRALKGDSRVQGSWGELVLERVLETAGLQAGREYSNQASFTLADGRRLRPDVLVHLPGGRDLIVDAKVSLLAWERFVASAEPAAREAALREHLTSLRRHVDALSGKRYEAIEGLHTLDFVLLFVPIEAAFIEALRADESLAARALAGNVALASPSTLLAILRTVAHLWRVERRNLNALEIARRGARLHDNFALLVEDLETLGAQLDKAQAAQAQVLRRLTEGGKGSLLLQVRALGELGAPVRRALPERLARAAD